MRQTPFTRASPLRVCFTTAIKKESEGGSWKIRGIQMAACRSNWEAIPMAEMTRRDLDRFDIFCIVKKFSLETVNQIHARKKVIVYDVLDSWEQPAEGLACARLSQARYLFQNKWKSLRAHSFIFPNRTMKQHLGDLTPHSVYIYHHYWPEIPLNPMRREVRTMGYQGNPAYLGRWQALLEKIALEKGMSFVINPSDWSSIDIGIAMRDGVHASFLATHYKSNVKLANFYGSGTPCLISSHERACQETDNGEALFFRSEEDFKRQMDLLGDYSRRLRIHESFLKTRSQFHIEAIANIYEHYFQTLYRNVVKAG